MKKIEKKKVVAIIQARSGSRRLPKKVYSKIEGKPMIQHVIERVKACFFVHTIVLATTTKKEDIPLIRIARRCGIEYFAGSAHDVLDRYYQAAKKFNAEVVVRVTGDCPLVDHELIGKMIEFYHAHHKKCNYVYPPNAYPEGVNDIEIFSFEALKNAWEKTILFSDREHVTPYIKRTAHTLTLPSPKKLMLKNYSFLHLSVDHPKDLRLVRKIYKHIYARKPLFTVMDIIKFFESHENTLVSNQDFTGSDGYRRSLKEDAQTLLASILIRVYNAEKTIDKAIKSAIHQTLPREQYEIIIVNDGSTDTTWQKLEHYSSPPFINVIYQGNKGGTAATLRALQMSRGSYFVCLDSDDYFLPMLLEKLSSVLNANPSVDFAYPDYYERFKTKTKRIRPKNVFESVTVGTLFRKKSLKNIPFFKPGLIFTEYDLFLRTIEKWKGKYVPEPLFVYSRSKNSATANEKFVQMGISQLLKLFPDKAHYIKKIRSYQLP